MATPSVSLSRDKVPLGSPIDITYKFVVAPDAKFTQNYRVMVHVVDPNEELMWTDDHDPPIADDRWKPGQTIEYTRTVFVPAYPYVGEATIQLGLYSKASRAAPAAERRRCGPAGVQGRTRAARAAERGRVLSLQRRLAPGGSRPSTTPMVEWHWTKKVGDAGRQESRRKTVVLLSGTRQPRRNLRGAAAGHGEHRAQDARPVHAARREATLLRKIALPAAALGTDENVRHSPSRSIRPSCRASLSPTSKDPRELGVRVFHAAVVESSR